MTDPGGGLGWRSARHLPRQRGGMFGWGRMADDAAGLFRDERPLCLLIEDGHWLDSSSRELLDLLVMSLVSRRILLLVTARTERGREVPGDAEVDER